MLCRLLSSFLLLTSLVWGQEQTIRIRPPFSGLHQNTNQTDIPDNGFFILSNAALTSTGEIYKRGAFSTIAGTVDSLDAVKVDSNNNSVGIGNMYRYYRTNGLRRLLVTTVGKNSEIASPGADSGQFGHWYWLNDTTGRFAYTHTATFDTLSQVDYRAGTIKARQNSTHRSEYLIDPTATFFLNCSNLSDIRWDFNLADGYGRHGYGVYVVNDTILCFEVDSLQSSDALADTILTGRTYEVHYRTAHTQTSTPTVFYAEAMTYLDTAYFCRGMADPIGWDGRQTHRVNILDRGVFTQPYLGASALRGQDNTKSWTTNQWSGMWLFLTKRNNFTEFPATAPAPNVRWYSNFYPIQRNGTDTIVIDSMVASRALADSFYAIVTYPIDEIVFERAVGAASGTGNDFIVMDTTYFTYRTQKMIYSNPLQVLITRGDGAGRRYQVIGIAKNTAGAAQDTLVLGAVLENSFTTAESRFALIKSRFPIAKFLRVYKDRTLWISDSIYQNSIYPSIPGRPGYIEPNTQIVVNPNDGERIQSAWVSEDGVYVGKESKIYILVNRSIETSGNDPDVWQVIQVSNTIGCESPKSVVQRAGTVWFYDWPNGFYEYGGGQFTDISSPLRPMIDSVTASARDKVWGVFYPAKKGDLILWGLPLNGSLKCNRVIAYSPQTKAWATWGLTNTDSIRTTVGFVQEGPGDAAEMFVGLADSAYLLRYKPDESVDTLNGADNTAGAGAKTVTFSLVAESKRFGLPGQTIRFTDITPMVFNGGTATVAYDFLKNLSSTTITAAQIAPSHAAGWVNFKKSLNDGVIGNYLAWKITTSSPQTFRFGGMDITVSAAGRRFPE